MKPELDMNVEFLQVHSRSQKRVSEQVSKFLPNRINLSKTRPDYRFPGKSNKACTAQNSEKRESKDHKTRRRPSVCRRAASLRRRAPSTTLRKRPLPSRRANRRAGTQRFLCLTVPQRFLRAPTHIGGAVARANERDIISGLDCRPGKSVAG